MDKPQVTIHDALTGESIVRDMTQTEIDALQIISDIELPNSEA